MLEKNKGKIHWGALLLTVVGAYLTLALIGGVVQGKPVPIFALPLVGLIDYWAYRRMHAWMGGRQEVREGVEVAEDRINEIGQEFEKAQREPLAGEELFLAFELPWRRGEVGRMGEEVLHLFATQEERDAWVAKGPPPMSDAPGYRQPVSLDEYGVFTASEVGRVVDHRRP